MPFRRAAAPISVPVPHVVNSTGRADTRRAAAAPSRSCRDAAVAPAHRFAYVSRRPTSNGKECRMTTYVPPDTPRQRLQA